VAARPLNEKSPQARLTGCAVNSYSHMNDSRVRWSSDGRLALWGGFANSIRKNAGQCSRRAEDWALDAFDVHVYGYVIPTLDGPFRENHRRSRLQSWWPGDGFGKWPRPIRRRRRSQGAESQPARKAWPRGATGSLPHPRPAPKASDLLPALTSSVRLTRARRRLTGSGPCGATGSLANGRGRAKMAGVGA
jgi:hypothetical protein